MLKTQLLHPQIIGALGRAGHSSKILISDGNYPHFTKRGPNAEMVYLNLSPGKLLVTEILEALVSTVPVELAEVMDYARTGPYALPKEPEIWSEFRTILKPTDCKGELGLIERFKFYEAGGSPDVCLTIASGDQRIFANLLLTIGVRR